MPQLPFTTADLRGAAQQYKSHTMDLPARTLDADSFWDEEQRMLAEFPEAFQQAGCIPEREYLKCLTKWKWAGLWANYAHENTRTKLRTVTGDAFRYTADNSVPSGEAVRRQLDRLSDLTGISAATGTVLLTFWRPDVYTVMDQRALGTLASAGLWTGDTDATVDDYPQYLDTCRSIADETGLSLRETDRALWALGE